MRNNRKNKFFEKYQRFGDMFFLSLLFIVTSLPVVTFGASLAALYTATAKVFIHDEGTILKMYMDAWKSNLKQGILLTVLALVLIAIGVLNVIGVNQLIAAGSVSPIFAAVAWVFFAPLAVTLPWIFIYLSRFNDSIGRIIKNSFLLGMSRFPITIEMLAIFILSALIFVVLIPVFPFVLMPLFEKVVRKSEPVLIELSKGSEGYDPDAWYNRKISE